jgi:hypothetical protein
MASRTSPFVLNPVKGAYMWRDLERICDVEGLPFRRPSRFPRGSLLATRIACRFVDAPWIGGFIRDVYTANFADDADIDEPDVIARLLTGGSGRRAVIEAATTPEAKAALRTQTEAAMAKGIFGAPTFDIGESCSGATTGCAQPSTGPKPPELPPSFAIASPIRLRADCAPGRERSMRKFLVVLDDTRECLNAMRFAAMRAANTQAGWRSCR